MLWYKAWLETRWRFIFGLVLLMMSASGSVLAYPQLSKLLPQMPAVDTSGEIGRRVMEAMELARSYRGWIWSQWWRQNLPQMWTVFAALLGTGGLLSQVSGGAALFTLSLPASRARLVGVRAATGLTELLALSIVPALLLPLLSIFIGQRYPLQDAIVHGLCLFVGGSIFFSLAFLLSTVFTDVWRPFLVAVCVAVALAIAEVIVRDLADYSVFRVMRAESYFRSGEVPWIGLSVSAAVSAALLYAAARNTARQDF